jgi:glycosyltransferase involved in cell wall biosynthesis
MVGESLSVVMPVLNEAEHLPATVDSLVAAIEASGFDTEVVIVDDGSTDGSGAVAARRLGERIPSRVIEQSNRGRLEARRAGLSEARGRWVLLLDGRVQIDTRSLAFVHDELGRRRDVWTAHVDIDADGNLFGIFWKLIADLAWREYFDKPRDASFGAEDFDRFPKGTGCLFAPRELLLQAVSAFRSRYSDPRHANDDTPILRWIANRRPINVSPRYRCSYRPRLTSRAFIRHAFHRGIVFVDGHGRAESRFFPAFVTFYPASALLAAAALRKPKVVPAALAAASLGAAAYGVAARRTRQEITALALLTPPYAVAHGLGMWRGLLAMTLRR